MAWLALIGAGCCEVLGVIFMRRVALQKNTKSFLLWVAAFAASFVLLALAMRTVPMSTAYAVWTGIGTVGTALTGMFLYSEPREWRRVLFIAMIICSAIGLKLLYGTGA
ncbi:multidrug efflux system protein [uncultured Sporomusa sp.]|uniref:Multidrug efflux system protein n=1 Tax=uncultured Sporomusa sp. TaxID=307249 RepID=A0A212LNV7_9FIRM|nr:multidrug efflux SMR transporter [uncultured Sporomusa sp.]SCM79109.1 multidrug efflux system protein [uncultured Sporomusa sp.]